MQNSGCTCTYYDFLKEDSADAELSAKQFHIQHTERVLVSSKVEVEVVSQIVARCIRGRGHGLHPQDPGYAHR